MVLGSIPSAGRLFDFFKDIVVPDFVLSETIIRTFARDKTASSKKSLMSKAKAKEKEQEEETVAAVEAQATGSEEGGPIPIAKLEVRSLFQIGYALN